MPAIPYRNPLSGDAGPHLYISRNRLNNAFVRDLLSHWQTHGIKIIEQVSREQPGTLLKCLTMMVPRELKIEHANPTDALSDEQLALMVAELEERISARLQGESAKLIDAQAEPEPREKQPFGEGRWRKKKPKTPPAQLEKARDRARRLAEVRKAKRVAEVADGEAQHAATAQAQTSVSNCTEKAYYLPSQLQRR